MAPWACGHQTARGRIYVSSQLAKAATAKGGGEELKMGTQELGEYHVLGVILRASLSTTLYISVAPEDTTVLYCVVTESLLADAESSRRCVSCPVVSV